MEEPGRFSVALPATASSLLTKLLRVTGDVAVACHLVAVSMATAGRFLPLLSAFII